MSLRLRIFINGTNPIHPRSGGSHLGACAAPCPEALGAFAPAVTQQPLVRQEPWQGPHQGLRPDPSLYLRAKIFQVSVLQKEKSLKMAFTLSDRSALPYPQETFAPPMVL